MIRLNFLMLGLIILSTACWAQNPAKLANANSPNAAPAVVPVVDAKNPPLKNQPPPTQVAAPPANLQPPAAFQPLQIPQQVGEIRRDPFRLPEYLINKFKFVPTREAARIDDSVDPIKRWPLNTYGLIGIIWDVKNPKALIMDQQRKVHMVRLRDKIGNAGGVITSIQEGSIVIIQDKIPEVMRLKK